MEHQGGVVPRVGELVSIGEVLVYAKKSHKACNGTGKILVHTSHKRLKPEPFDPQPKICPCAIDRFTAVWKNEIKVTLEGVYWHERE